MIHIKPETILLKGTKVVTVKASKRSKAHKRKVKISDKKKKEEEISPVKRVVDFYESTIKDQSFESAGAFSEDGSILFQKDGEKDLVKFDKKEMELCKGSIFTHNHPSNNRGFSPADVKFACQTGMKEMRVITPNKGGSSIKMEDGTNFNMELWNDRIKHSVESTERFVRFEFGKKIRDKIMTVKEANDNHWNEIWDRVANDIMNLKYEVK